MEIALLANDSKKELMVQFCTAYVGILGNHRLCSTRTTGKLVSDATSIPVELYMSGSQGGIEQLTARISFNEIDLVIYLRDPQKSESLFKMDNDLLRACDANNVPVATNLASAEVMLRALEHGDMDWREIVNPNSDYNRRKKEREVGRK